jgi:hypothetical protein
MILEQLYYLSEVVGVVIVTGALIFVGQQMRQNARALRVSATAAGVANWQSTVLELASSDHIVPAYARVNQASKPGDLIYEDIVRVAALSTAAAKNAEFAYYRHQAREIDGGFWEAALNGLLQLFTTSMAREIIWPMVKVMLSPDFASYMDKALSEHPVEASSVWPPENQR